MAQDAPRVRSWLRNTHKLSVPGDWLEACIEWIHAENEGPTAPTFHDVCSAVFEQWLVADLREIGASCLPPQVASEEKYELSGSFGLQVNFLADVSQAFYGQHQKVTNTENSNALVSAEQSTQIPKEESTRSRMLMLQLTDGTTEVRGMEYQPITALNVNLAPGTKIVIRGDILCRCGVLMLMSDNVTVLGGEVESLLQDGQQEKVISATLSSNAQKLEQRLELPRTIFDSSTKKQSTGLTPSVPPSAACGSSSSSYSMPKPSSSSSSSYSMPKPSASSSSSYSMPKPSASSSSSYGMPKPSESSSSSYSIPKPSARSATSRQTPLSAMTASGHNPVSLNAGRFQTGSTSYGCTLSSAQSSKFPQNLSSERPCGWNQSAGSSTGFSHIDAELDFPDDDDDIFLQEALEVQALAEQHRSAATTAAAAATSATKSHSRSIMSLPSSTHASSIPGGRDVGRRKDENSYGGELESKKVKMESNIADLDFDYDDFDDEWSALAEIDVNVATSTAQEGRNNRCLAELTSLKPSAGNVISHTEKKALRSPATDCKTDIIPPIRNLENSGSSNRLVQSRPLSAPSDASVSWLPPTNRLKVSDSQLMMDVDDISIGCFGTNNATIVGRQLPKSDLKWAAATPGSTTFDDIMLVPFTYLSMIASQPPSDKCQLYSVKAYIATLLGRLEYNGGRYWSLLAKINDGSATLDVIIGDEMLTRLIGFTAEQSLKIKEAKTDKLMKQSLTEGLRRCQETLTCMSAILDVEVSGSRLPCVLRYRDVTAADLQTLERRIIQLSLT